MWLLQHMLQSPNPIKLKLMVFLKPAPSTSRHPTILARIECCSLPPPTPKKVPKFELSVPTPSSRPAPTLHPNSPYLTLRTFMLVRWR